MLQKTLGRIWPSINYNHNPIHKNTVCVFIRQDANCIFYTKIQTLSPLKVPAYPGSSTYFFLSIIIIPPMKPKAKR